MLDYDTFAEFFRHNLNTRSRTSKGASDTSVSPDKPQLIGDEDYRIAKVAENTELLIDSVWSVFSAPQLPFEDWDERVFLQTVSEWAQLNSRDLFDWPAYQSQVLEFCKRENIVPMIFDMLWRTWDSDKYGYAQATAIPDVFRQYSEVMYCILAGDGLRLDPATVLGMADYLHDGYAHPWADACGRTSVAIAMFFSAVLADRNGKVLLPRYPDRRSLYASFNQGTTGAIGFYADCLAEV
jgi:hypothetical protein